MASGRRTRAPAKLNRENDMQVQSYLFFDGHCDEAIDFYKAALGAEDAMLMRWKDNPDKSVCTSTNADNVCFRACTSAIRR